MDEPTLATWKVLVPLLVGAAVTLAGVVYDDLVMIVVGGGFMGVPGLANLATLCGGWRRRGRSEEVTA